VGCSAVGYFVGSEMDSKPITFRPATAAEVAASRPGEISLVLELADSSRVEGIYQGLEARPESAYAARYAAWRESAGLAFVPPRLHETIDLRGWKWPTVQGPLKTRGAFLGFAPGLVHLEHKGRPIAADLPMLERITCEDGHVIAGDALIAAADRLPKQTIAMLRDTSGSRRVDLEDPRITGVRIGPPPRTARWWGLALGGLVDLSAAIWAASQ
jgi:hypothetical protein